MNGYQFGDSIVYLIGYSMGMSFVLSLYMVPFIAALARKPPHKWWVRFLNFATGWTAVGCFGQYSASSARPKPHN
jgi:hypothetical protein